MQTVRDYDAKATALHRSEPDVAAAPRQKITVKSWYKCGVAAEYRGDVEFWLNFCASVSLPPYLPTSLSRARTRTRSLSLALPPSRPAILRPCVPASLSLPLSRSPSLPPPPPLSLSLSSLSPSAFLSLFLSFPPYGRRLPPLSHSPLLLFGPLNVLFVSCPKFLSRGPRHSTASGAAGGRGLDP